MTGGFDATAFDNVGFWTGIEAPPPPPHGGSRPLRIRLEVDDAEEAALLVALLRHRFRL